METILAMKEQISNGKVVPVLTYTPYHENVWGSEGIAPHKLNISTRRRLKVSLTPGCSMS